MAINHGLHSKSEIDHLLFTKENCLFYFVANETASEGQNPKSKWLYKSKQREDVKNVDKENILNVAESKMTYKTEQLQQ